MTNRVFRASIFLLMAAVWGPWPGTGIGAEVAGREDIAKRVAQIQAHPRLYWTKAEERSVQTKIQTDPQLKGAWEAVRITAEHMLTEAPVVYRKEGRRLLGRSREALSRITHLGMAFRLTGEARFLERGVAEMKAMAAMTNWNPSHFLDTAEMTMALAVGYDWFYDRLSPADRALAREAIENKGLKPYLEAKTRLGWERGGNNWNQVCHAGMVAGALALAEDKPDRAVEVVARALAGLPSAMKVYEPDGTYPEGPGYWNYGTTLNVALISMLESALGTDFGLTRQPGFLKTGDFILQMTGPTGAYFNFSDCGQGTGFSPAMVWFAGKARRPDLLWFEQDLLAREVRQVQRTRGRDQADRYFPLTLVWAEAGQARQVPSTLDWFGRGPNPLAVFRSSWTDSNALYLAIKAGSPGASHAHMDIGSFVLDADGVRWSLDLGAQNYNTMETRGLDIWNNRSGSDRWRIFRYHNRAHSTLMVDDQEQVVQSHAPISEFSAHPQHAFAVVDMSATYATQLAGAIRRFSVQPDRTVVIEDKLRGGTKDHVVRWAMTTRGTLVQNNGQPSWLEHGGKRLNIAVAHPAGTSLQTWPADPPPHDFDEPNPNVRLVGFTTSVRAGEEVTLRVSLKPVSP